MSNKSITTPDDGASAAGFIPAVAYLRVSTMEQAKTGTSLETQLPRCEAAATEAGGTIIAVFSDNGVSGALYLARPDIQRALAEIESGRAKMLVFADVDRSGRDVDVVRDIAKRVYLAGAKFVLADEGVIPYDTKGKTSLTLRAMFAEWERDAIRERTMRGRRKKAAQGKQPCRQWSPYGYHIVTVNDVLLGLYPAGTDGTYVLVEEQVQIAREIFERVYNGGSIRSVVRWLNESGVPTPSKLSKTQVSGIWYQSTVHNILRGPVYKGRPIWGKTEARTDERRLAKGHTSPYYTVPTASHAWVELSAPPIVSDEVWEAVQERLDTNKSRLGGNPERKYLLSGLLRCPKCLGAMGGVSYLTGPVRKDGTRYRDSYYFCIACSVRNGHPDNKSCGENRTRMEMVESLFVEILGGRIADPQLLTAAIAGWQQVAKEQRAEAPSNVAAARLTQIEKLLAALRTRETAIVEAQIAGVEAGADVSIYAGKLRELGQERRSLIKQQEELLATADALGGDADQKAANSLLEAQPNAVGAWLSQAGALLGKQLRENWLTISEKRELIGEIVVRVIPVAKDALDIELVPFGYVQGNGDGTCDGGVGGVDASADAIRRRMAAESRRGGHATGGNALDTVQRICSFTAARACEVALSAVCCA